MNNQKYNRISNLFKVMSNPSRVQMTLLLKHNPMTVTEVMKVMEKSQSLSSYHLRYLYDANVLDCEDRGSKHFYSLNEETLGILREFFEDLNDDNRPKSD